MRERTERGQYTDAHARISGPISTAVGADATALLSEMICTRSDGVERTSHFCDAVPTFTAGVARFPFTCRQIVCVYGTSRDGITTFFKNTSLYRKKSV
jgi:hypothetical protein